MRTISPACREGEEAMPEIQIFFATNRDYQAGKARLFGGSFNPDGVAALRFGKAKYDVGHGKPKRTGIQVYADAKAGQTKSEAASVGSGAFLNDLKQLMKEGCADTLVFIHGYNVTFLEALDAGASLAAQISINDKPLNVVVFSWPSEGTAVPWMSYYSDREDARACGPALARTYLKLFEFIGDLAPADFCGRNIHLLCHSMGNYVLRHGLQALMVKEPKKLVRLFTEIVLAAPDEDDDAFELDSKLRLLPSLGRRVTVYHNDHDRALLVSDKTKANPDRLGSDGPRMLDLLPKKVVIVDCSRVAGEGDELIQHSYFVACPPVVADLHQALSGLSADAIGNREMIRAERAYRIRPATRPPA
jgi:esterase/lipase superfamily enzyme